MPELTDTVIATLNGFAIGDKNITLSRAKSGNDASIASSRHDDGTGSSYYESTNQQQQYPSHQENAQSGYGSYPSYSQMEGSRAAASRVVLLTNMLDIRELYDDNEYASILADIQSETGRHGSVKVEVIIPVD